MSLQTKIGEKVSILVDRVMELWNGNANNKKKGKNNVKVSQPISGQITGQSMNPAAAQALYNDGTAISSLPINDSGYESENTTQSQQLPNYNDMYKQDTTQLVGAATPGGNGQESFGPVAASEFLGGGNSFGSSW